MIKEDKKNIKRVMCLFKPYKWKIIMVIVSILVSSLLSMLIPVVNQKLMDEGFVLQNFEIIIKFSVYELLLILMIQLAGVFETKYRVYIENLIAFNLEKRAFRQLLKMKMSFFNDKNYSEIMSNLQTDIKKISSLCDRNTFFILTSIFRILVGIIGTTLISWKITLLMLCVIPLKYFIVQFLSKKRIVLFGKYIKTYQEYSGWQGDTLAGIKEVKSWNLEELKISEFIKKQRTLIKQNIKISYLEKANDISESIFSEIIIVIINIIGGYMLLGQSFTVGKLFAFITYSKYVTEPIFAIMNLSYIFAGILPSVNRYFDFMNIECEGNNKVKLQKVNSKNIKGSIEFRNVTFSYNKKELILKDINFKINAGEKVAIVGKNGAGKTTIINMILRFLIPDSGEILLDGKDIQNIDLRGYRKLISVVSQDVYLFNKTIKENIMLNSKKTDDEMYSVVRKCGADKFINEMPDRYKALVGERGSKLSGGERQKIAMARALIRESKILILDEATANYDTKSEREINNIIKKNDRDKTIIVISHKPDILEKVDKIIVINNGQVDDMGNHSDLYGRNELYRQMFNVPDEVTI